MIINAFLVSAVLNVFFSCVMCKKETFFIKNCTDDTLMIDLTESDTLADWEYWRYRTDLETLPQKDRYGVDMAFIKAAVGCKVFPSSTFRFDPYVFYLKDTCCIYVINMNVAKSYTMDEIRAKRLYDRRTVTRKDFDCNNTYEYR